MWWLATERGVAKRFSTRSRGLYDLALKLETSRVTGSTPDCCTNFGAAKTTFSATANSTPPTLYTWGNGDYGRLGQGPQCENVTRPRPIVRLAGLAGGGGCGGVSKVSSGGAHTLLLDAQGRVYSMGLNESGQLGQGTEDEFVSAPTRVKGIDEPIRDISAGRDHSVCVSVQGNVYVCGSNRKGKLGLGKKAKAAYESFQINDYLKDYPMDAVALGAGHTLSLSKEGEVFSWGSSSYGVLGHGMQKTFVFISSRDEWVPRKVQALDGTVVKSIASGDTYSGCIDKHGHVYTWGQGSFWKLGLERDVDVWYPEQVRDLTYVKKLAFGFSHSMALTHNGKIFVWGANENGCLGIGKKGRAMRTPQKLEIDEDVVDISCGWKHSAAVTREGKLLTWGWGGSMGTSSIYDTGGQLGHDNAFDFWEPKEVAMETKLLADSVSCGFNHTSALFSPVR